MNKFFKVTPKGDAGRGCAMRERRVSEDYPIHMHDCFEIEYILSGKGVYTINTEEYKAQKNTLLFFTPSDVASLKVTEPIKLLNINFTEDYVDSKLLAFLAEPKVIHTGNNVLLDALFNEHNRKGPLYEICVKSYLTLILADLIRNNNRDGTLIDDKAVGVIAEVANYIRVNYKKPVSMRVLSGKFGYSPNYLSSLFHKTYGVTVMQTVISLRLEQAVRLLILTDMSITDICFSAGFESMDTFLRNFKKTYKKTPKAFRTENKNNYQLVENVVL